MCVVWVIVEHSKGVRSWRDHPESGQGCVTHILLVGLVLWPDSELLLDHSELRDELLRDHTGMLPDSIFYKDDGRICMDLHGQVETEELRRCSVGLLVYFVSMGTSFRSRSE